MFLLMLSGYCIYRLCMLTNSALRELSNLLVKFIAPFVMICSFNRAFSFSLLQSLLVMLGCSFLSFGIGIIISKFLYPPAKYDNYINRRMCVTYSNNGFMALPLLSAMLGSIGVFYGSAHIVASTVLTWVYSAPQLEGGTTHKPNLKKVLYNPGTVALVLGLLLFISPVKPPEPVLQAMNYIASLNTPLAMIILGCFLAQTDLLSCFRDMALLKICLQRLLLVPLLVVALVLIVPLDETARVALLIGCAAPVAINVATFAQVYDTDFLFCTRAVALSTLLCILTMPALLALYSMLRTFL